MNEHTETKTSPKSNTTDMNTPQPTSDGSPHVIDRQSPSGQYVWDGDQYVPIEDFI